MPVSILTKREQDFVEWSQNEFNTYMKEWGKHALFICFHNGMFSLFNSKIDYATERIPLVSHERMPAVSAVKDAV